MQNVTLVCTHHSEIGNCNAGALFEIIESIRPEVIFDEIPKSSYEIYYGDSFDLHYMQYTLLKRNAPFVPLEVKSIKKYRQNNIVEIKPVDIDVRGTLSKYEGEILFMINTFFKNEEYKNLDKENDALIEQKGFDYLNSDLFLDFIIRKESLEKDIIETETEKDRLLTIYNVFQRIQYDERENAMLQNIYSYCKLKQYRQAVFLVGAQHKRSIMRKISQYEKLSEINLNWKMYDITIQS